MDNLKKIARALGYAADDIKNNRYIADRVRNISKKLTAKPGDANFVADCERAQQEVDSIGANAFSSLIFGLQAAQEPKERVYKIKPVKKGERIKVVSASGVRFSFGEVWCDSVRACKGIALNENNREKLNMHGTHLGVADPEKMTARELCAAITTLM